MMNNVHTANNVFLLVDHPRAPKALEIILDKQESLNELVNEVHAEYKKWINEMEHIKYSFNYTCDEDEVFLHTINDDKSKPKVMDVIFENSLNLGKLDNASLTEVGARLICYKLCENMVAIKTSHYKFFKSLKKTHTFIYWGESKRFEEVSLDDKILDIPSGIDILVERPNKKDSFKIYFKEYKSLKRFIPIEGIIDVMDDKLLKSMLDSSCIILDGLEVSTFSEREKKWLTEIKMLKNDEKLSSDILPVLQEYKIKIERNTEGKLIMPKDKKIRKRFLQVLSDNLLSGNLNDNNYSINSKRNVNT